MIPLGGTKRMTKLECTNRASPRAFRDSLFGFHSSFELSPHLFPNQIVKIHDVTWGLGSLELDGRARMFVQKPRQHIRQVKAPLELVAQRFDGVLHAA